MNFNMAAATKKNIAKNSCIIKSLPHRELTTGYTRVRVMPENYSKILVITGVTGKTIQDVVDELLKFAISNTKIDVDGTVIDLSSIGENE